MKFGVREICDVVLKAKANQKVGDKIFYKGEPVIYFDTLKTSSMEGAATTVYAQGGRGNSRLVAWEGERTVTFTMEDALISPAGFMILSGAGLVSATADKPIYVHVAETTDKVYPDEATNANAFYIIASQKDVADASDNSEASIYVMPMSDDEILTEPFLGQVVASTEGLKLWGESYVAPTEGGTIEGETTTTTPKVSAAEWAKIQAAITEHRLIKVSAIQANVSAGTKAYAVNEKSYFIDEKGNMRVVTLDYYTKRTSSAQQIDITPDKFGGNYYLEASTLFRATNGVDMPAEFIIPNCKIQSNFTFTMASSGDPSTFTFTMDAFPDYTRFDKTKKVLAAIQIISDELSGTVSYRSETNSDDLYDEMTGLISKPAKSGTTTGGTTTGGTTTGGENVDG